eukprot:gnl/Chilomastix_cuspidata/1760.p2 GENE.gnl/Chilomastix_cuspidata/1760~~gnl/Chilomastix_cuspidata/1760.p2  ORF type:complete len:505 (-),score=273.27 gnl/Chilomastix_cuspidata/1760:1336-2850(-)
MADASIRSDASDGSAEGTPGEKQEIPKGHISARFRKFKDELLGHGAFKAVYKAFDLEEGREVAWNEIALEKLDSTEISKLSSEISLLREIKHDHIIRFFGSWVTPDAKELVFITECMSSGTLRQYIARRERGIPPRVVKNWCVQILTGLEFLHSLEPRVIHRDLKCDNVFINGSTGEVKIGDLGISRRLPEAHFAQTIVGTPEFMAPECFEGIYDEKADIWAFGQLVIEMCTRETPYHECGSSFKVYERIKGGQMPESFARVEHADLRDVIARCIRYRPEERPSARELLDLALWTAESRAASPVSALLPISLSAPPDIVTVPAEPWLPQPTVVAFTDSPDSTDLPRSATSDAVRFSDAASPRRFLDAGAADDEEMGAARAEFAPAPAVRPACPVPHAVRITGKGAFASDAEPLVTVTLGLEMCDGAVHNVDFLFDIASERSADIAQELADEFKTIMLVLPRDIELAMERVLSSLESSQGAEMVAIEHFPEIQNGCVFQTQGGPS